MGVPSKITPRRLALGLVWLLLTGLGYPVCPAACDEDPCALRYQALCAYVAATGARDIEVLLDVSQVGKRPFDVVYGRWYHALGKVRDNLSLYRRARFAEALRGALALRLLPESDGCCPGLVTDERARLRPWITSGQSLGQVLASGDLAPGDRLAMLLACDAAAREVLLATAPVGATVADPAATQLLRLPLIAAARARRVVEEVKQSSTDPDLTAACDRVLRELGRSETDYLERLVVALGDSAFVRWLQAQLATHAAVAVVKPLLSKLGLVSAAGYATTIVGALFVGWDVAMSLAGESAAYPHARLAHFADAMRPGLWARWVGLRTQLAASTPQVCESFDAATQAGLILSAFVNQEGLLMEEAYSRAPLSRQAPPDGFLPPSLFQQAYRSWMTGATLAPYAPQ